MRRAPTMAACLLVLAAVDPTSASAQAARAAEPKAAATLHEAWLAEVMDLDVGRAAALYGQVAHDARPGNLERWVATARLAELHRTGVATGIRADAADAPQPLRSALAAALTPLDPTTLVQRTTGEPGQLLQSLGADAGKLPPLRTVVPTAEAWLLGQIGPSLRDRSRQRQQSLANRNRTGDWNRLTERVYATLIVRAELEGRRPQADALRSLYFAEWQPPAASGEPAANLARIRTNLEAWLRERELTAPQQALLQALGDAIERAAAKSPAEAMALLGRLPHYADRLLREPVGDGR